MYDFIKQFFIKIDKQLFIISTHTQFHSALITLLSYLGK